MPILPKEQPEPSPAEPHEARRMAESFGVDARRYDQARPGYPDVIDSLGGRFMMDYTTLAVTAGTS